MKRELTPAEKEMGSLFKMARLLKSESHLNRARAICDMLDLDGKPKTMKLVKEADELEQFLQAQCGEVTCLM